MADYTLTENKDGTTTVNWADGSGTTLNATGDKAKWMIKALTEDPNHPKVSPESKYIPAGEADHPYYQWLATAKPGDTFDWYAKTGNATDKGLTNRFDGYNQLGAPMFTTLQSEERLNWRNQIDSLATPEQNIKKLMNVGFDATQARWLVGMDQGWDYVRGVGVVSGNGTGSGTGTGTGTGSGTGTGAPSTVTLADGTVVPTTGLTASQANAIENLSRVFQNYGLGTLAGAILNMVKQGYSADTVSLMLQDTPEYKQRFAANEARRKAGMAVLSPAEYLATEKSYRQIMNAAGLPKGFYDQQEDFTDFISKDISPGELNARIQNASESIMNADPYYTQALRDMYGMTTGDMIAFVLSPDRSLPIIQQKANAVSFGAAAARQGVQGVDNATAEMYGGMGVEKAQAEQGFAQIATQLPRSEQLGDIYGIDYGVDDAVSETFGNNAKAQQKRRRLVQAETDSFGGQSGVRGGTLGQATQGLI